MKKEQQTVNFWYCALWSEKYGIAKTRSFVTLSKL